MISKYYECDGGSLAIGTVEARASFINCYGDGRHTVEVYETESCYGERNNLMFRGAVQGTVINVYDYDCLTDEECNDPKHILFTLSGRYGVYARENSGDMVLEKWE